MIQTVTGPVDRINQGKILMHEHISCSSASFVPAFGTKWLDKSRLKTLSVETLIKVNEKYGLSLMVDATPIDIGRDAMLLKEVSELSGVRIVASTGFYHLHSIETLNNSPEEIAVWLIDECKNGIADTGIRPGILKCATGNMGITADNLKKLSAMGIVQNETGLPVYVHCEHNDDIVFRQLEILLENGADINKIIIGHTSIRPETDYLEKVLQKGCYICIDQCHCYPQRTSVIANTLVELCKKGYSRKIVVSNDYCIHSDFCNHKSTGMHITADRHAENIGYIFNLYSDFISAGGDEKNWSAFFRENALDVLDI